MNKVQISFDSHNHHLKLGEITKKVKALNEALVSVLKITDEEVAEIDHAKIDDYLNQKTGFKNADMSADALGIKNEYKAILSVDKNLEYIIYKDSYKVDTEALKEAYTIYMDPKATEIYFTLEKALKPLQGVNISVMQSVGRDWQIDKARLNNIIKLMSR